MISIARNEAPVFDENGFSCREVLQNTHKLVRPFRCTLKAGCSVSPALTADSMQMYCFIQGSGYVAGIDCAYNIKELSFYVPNFDNEAFTIRASSKEDLEYVVFDVKMLESDKIAFEDTHSILPFFKSLSQCEPYTQTCKGPDTKSYMVVHYGDMARMLCGVCISIGGGTKEAGHPEVDQWNVTLPGSDFTFYVENEEVHHEALEVSFVKGGLDHGLIAKPGKKVAYIWFEHWVEEKQTKVQSYDANGAKYGRTE